jgi:hypothetical protein
MTDSSRSSRQKRIDLFPASPWRIAAALAGLLAASSAPAQQPQFGQGFPRQGQPPSTSPAESNAYSAAISLPDPDARVSAIQQFLAQYPNSSLRQPAIAQMMLAKRAVGATGGPVSAPMNRAMTPPVAATSTASLPAPAATSQPAAPPHDSLLQHPAKPAQVSVASGNLTIKADNSSLTQILHDISTSTGMKVDGLGQDDRIFGTYGPGNSREVLLSLLQGLGYNVLMVGNANGAPRQLSLSQRSAASTVAAAGTTRNTKEEEDDEVEQEQPPPPEPPQPANQPPPGNGQNPDGTQSRNPAEIQQELLRLRQQQQQQQQSVPQQQPQ